MDVAPRGQGDVEDVGGGDGDGGGEDGRHDQLVELFIFSHWKDLLDGQVGFWYYNNKNWPFGNIQFPTFLKGQMEGWT
ncbi:hypothetical protein CE91St43_03400 [Oscillospiraceae bacterium]|nr:hypothetical protein CE91St43_03400 [Oscillospiraceae bacterium]